MAKLSEAAAFTQAEAAEAVDFATTTKVGVTCSSAAAGIVVGGTGGATVGTIGGAAVGLVPAVFTFGLSIPLGAAAGLCIGATTGATCGGAGGGAVGFAGFTYKKEISDGAHSAWAKARSSADRVKAKAKESATKMTESVRTLVGGGTGGTD